MDEIKNKIESLVEKYEQVLNSNKKSTYSEQDTKNAFITPLFEALGWDISNRDEVSSEESLKSGGRVDYCFYLNGRPVFYLEAKPLKADLEKEEFAWQAIKYSWNKGVNYAILTDFESLKVFNSQIIDGSLMDRLIFEIPYKNYTKDIEKLWLLSKQSFQDKSLDKYADEHAKKLKVVSVSVETKLYKDIQKCRELLADSFKTYNNIDPDLLDEGVQKLLDRLVFLRVAEDRGVETYTLKELSRDLGNIREKKETNDVYHALISRFRELDEIYNSNLFSKHSFEDWEEHSQATEEVIKILYGKEGYYEYNFKDIPADVLGGIYENYLGHRLEKSKKGVTVAKDAKKRKEQGIYYTPVFIVDYIVKNAIKPVLDKCQNISDLQKIKVLDPACGSGSFLVKAMDFIVEKYKDFGATDNTQLRLQVLMQNIYGVDLDKKAVEIARLNLLINALKEKEKLPLLDNVKNGNSLISGTDEELTKYFGKNFKDKIPFNWQEEFPEVFKHGGFDVIIGNPPYIFARGGNFDDQEKTYYSDSYKKLQQYQLNTFLLFIEKGYDLLRENGLLGFIIPNNWLTINSFSKLREFLLKNTADLRIINAVETVFNQASVDTCLLLFTKSEPTFVEVGELCNGENPVLFKHSPEDFYENEFVINLSTEEGSQKMFELKNIISLGEISDVKSGIVAYEVGKGNPPQTEEMKNDRVYHSEDKKGEEWIKYLDGVDVKRYVLDWSEEYIQYGDNLAAPRKPELFEKERILVRQIPSPFPSCINAVYTEEKYINDRNSNNILNPKEGYDLKYILGAINSKLLSYWFVKTFDKFQRKIFPQFKVNELAKFPIYKATQKQQKNIIVLVDKILLFNKKLGEIEKDSDEWNNIKSEIQKTDNKINEEVYKLYGLTEEEIRIIEEAK